MLKKPPVIPGPTCKYIDHLIQTLTEEVKPLIKDEAREYYLHILTKVKADLEYIRECNRQLREVGKYYKKNDKGQTP